MRVTKGLRSNFLAAAIERPDSRNKEMLGLEVSTGQLQTWTFPSSDFPEIHQIKLRVDYGFITNFCIDWHLMEIRVPLRAPKSNGQDSQLLADPER